MFLPVGDTPNPRMTPYVTWALMALNVIIYLVVTLPLSSARPDLSDPMLYEYFLTFGQGRISLSDLAGSVTAYDLLVFRYGFRPAAPDLVSLMTAMFLHGGLMHLAGNMLFLWIFGDNVEHRLGSLGFLFAYLGTGVAATLVFALFAIDSPYPMIGASGAISGVLGSYFVWFPRNQVKTFVFLFPLIMQTVLIPARWVLGFYLVIDNLLPFLGNASSATGVAHGAHIGGFLAGLALAWGLDRHMLRQVFERLGSRLSGMADAREESASVRFARLLEGGQARQAHALFSRSNRQERRTFPSQNVLELGNLLLESGESFAALSLFRRFISERPADPEVDRAYLGAGRAMLAQPRGATSAYHYFLSALDTARHPQVAAEARRNLEQITGNRE